MQAGGRAMRFLMQRIVFSFLFCAALALPPLKAQAQLVAWGDSLTQGAGGTPWPTQFETLSGLTVLNQGVGGDTSTQIKNRFMAEPQYFGAFAFIWAGGNNYEQPAVVQADIASMVGALQNPSFMILAVTNGDFGGYTRRGGEGWSFITGLNAVLGSQYGDHFVDVRTILISNYDPSDPQDVLDFRDDIIPSSLRSDQAHLNTKGYGIVAQAVHERYVALTSPVPDVPTGMAFMLGGVWVCFAAARARQASTAIRTGNRG